MTASTRRQRPQQSQSGWDIVHVDGDYHVIPCGDLKTHSAQQCWCHPTEECEEGASLYIHNSMDGREEYEAGRLPH